MLGKSLLASQVDVLLRWDMPCVDGLLLRPAGGAEVVSL